MNSFTNALLPGITGPYNMEEIAGIATAGTVMYIGLSMGVPSLDAAGAMQMFLIAGTTVGSYQMARYATKMIKSYY